MQENSMMRILRRINNVRMSELDAAGSGYLPLLCGRSRVGTVPLEAVDQMKLFPDVFKVGPSKVEFTEDLNNYESISQAMASFLQNIREKNLFSTLSGWRNECYEIRTKFSQTPFFKVERSATPLLGLPQYGVHINGYQELTDSPYKKIWVQKRSSTKQTYPGKFDSFVGGGYSEGYNVLETAVKEIHEEAGLVVTKDLRLQPCGSVSFFHKSDRGLHPQTEFVFDLKLPESFTPANQDGEVDDFQLVTPQQLLQLIQTEDYKVTSIPIALDWLIRHGELSVDTSPDISQILAEIHLNLHQLYSTE